MVGMVRGKWVGLTKGSPGKLPLSTNDVIHPIAKFHWELEEQSQARKRQKRKNTGASHSVSSVVNLILDYIHVYIGPSNYQK